MAYIQTIRRNPKTLEWEHWVQPTGRPGFWFPGLYGNIFNQHGINQPYNILNDSDSLTGKVDLYETVTTGQVKSVPQNTDINIIQLQKFEDITISELISPDTLNAEVIAFTFGKPIIVLYSLKNDIQIVNDTYLQAILKIYNPEKRNIAKVEWKLNNNIIQNEADQINFPDSINLKIKNATSANLIANITNDGGVTTTPNISITSIDVKNHKLFGKNLIKNSDASTGIGPWTTVRGTPESARTWNPISNQGRGDNWSTFININNDDPNRKIGPHPSQLSNNWMNNSFFEGGTDENFDYTDMYYDIDLSEIADVIDGKVLNAQTVRAKLFGYLGGEGNVTYYFIKDDFTKSNNWWWCFDRVKVQPILLDENDNPINDKHYIFNPFHGRSRTTLFLRNVDFYLPFGTRKIRVFIKFERWHRNIRYPSFNPPPPIPPPPPVAFVYTIIDATIGIESPIKSLSLKLRYDDIGDPDSLGSLKSVSFDINGDGYNINNYMMPISAGTDLQNFLSDFTLAQTMCGLIYNEANYTLWQQLQASYYIQSPRLITSINVIPSDIDDRVIHKLEISVSNPSGTDTIYTFDLSNIDQYMQVIKSFTDAVNILNIANNLENNTIWQEINGQLSAQDGGNRIIKTLDVDNTGSNIQANFTTTDPNGNEFNNNYNANNISALMDILGNYQTFINTLNLIDDLHSRLIYYQLRQNFNTLAITADAAISYPAGIGLLPADGILTALGFNHTSGTTPGIIITQNSDGSFTYSPDTILSIEPSTPPSEASTSNTVAPTAPQYVFYDDPEDINVDYRDNMELGGQPDKSRGYTLTEKGFQLKHLTIATFLNLFLFVDNYNTMEGINDIFNQNKDIINKIDEKAYSPWELNPDNRKLYPDIALVYSSLIDRINDLNSLNISDPNDKINILKNDIWFSNRYTLAEIEAAIGGQDLNPFYNQRKLNQNFY